MASIIKFPQLLIVVIGMLCSLQHSHVSCFQFEVGGSQGWVIPPANDSKVYNDWASENRFQVGDTIHFKYKKDSVMAVTNAEYKNCNSSRPIFFSNTGNTIYALNHSGSYFFISGVYGHCQKGQKMIVKVISSSDDSTGGSSSSASAVQLTFETCSAPALVLVQLLMSYVVSVIH